MKRSGLFSFVSLLYLSFSFFHGELISQDTTVVQTFTWDSVGRSGYFDFPDDPSIQYEKILLAYTMRCFNAEVGNGNVGCKEWDYSCNTFIHTPEVMDSSISYAWDHDVSQHNEDYFAYTTQTHFTYYSHDRIQTQYKKILSEQLFETEAGEDNVSIPAGEPGKLFLLFTRDELRATGLTQGPIDGITVDVHEGMAQMSLARVRICNTIDTILSDFWHPGETCLEVFFDDLFLEPGSNRIRFHTSFDWDGESNLGIEWSYEQLSGSRLDFSGMATPFSRVMTAEKTNNGALEFGGSWGVEIPPTVFDPIEDQISIVFWAFGRPQFLPARNTTAMEGLDAAGNRTVNIHLPWSNSGIYWDCGNKEGSYDRINKTAEPAEFEGEWHHWAFTKNSSTGEMNIYLDGRLWHSGTDKKALTDIHSFRIGSSVSHNLGYYGLLDECSFWKTALDETAVRQLMNGVGWETQAFSPHLLAWYAMDEGSGQLLTDSSPNGHHAYFEGGPEWRISAARDLHSHFKGEAIRPAIGFYRGNYEMEHQMIPVIDTLITPKNSVIRYAVLDSRLVAVDTFFVWEALDSKVYNEFGEELESFYVEPEEFLLFEELAYFTFRPAKLELLSLVTPYGNGLDLGPEGKTFIFDVSDFAPVLKGQRRLTIEFGAWQEELDLKFLFIHGVPARDVLSIRNIWPFDRGYYDPILKDKIFETRSIQIPATAQSVKIRSSVTGHGQNGEFVARKHRISLNGNQKNFDFDVWKECSFNPIYPQGGTWVYDRAGWCPGMATDLHEFEIGPYIQSGQPVEIDYTVTGPYMDEANYLVSNQIVFYGPKNFLHDADLEQIIRPNQENVDFARMNPNCTSPSVLIRNRGQEELTTMEIVYGVEGVSQLNYTWEGTLGFLESEMIYLPVGDMGFWGSEHSGVFFTEILTTNSITDEYPANNRATSVYVRPDEYEGNERWLLRVRTNNRAAENKYSLYDQAGNIILSRQSLANNTTYDDEISLPPGCYSFLISDSGNDGLSFWHNPSAGSGWVSIRRIVNETVSFEKIKFESDFGGEFSYDFVIDELTGVNSPIALERIGIHPNPVDDQLHIELAGKPGSVHISIVATSGKTVLQQTIRSDRDLWEKSIDISDFPSGHYYIRLESEGSVWVRPFIKI